jgi:hypothetical protein
MIAAILLRLTRSKGSPHLAVMTAVRVLMCLAIAATIQANPQGIPVRIPSADPTLGDAWISVRAALRPNGVWDDQMNGQAVELYRKALGKQRAKGADVGRRCTTYFGAMVPGSAITGSAAELIEKADAIVMARVISEEPGFLIRSPGTLMRLHLDVVAKSSGQIDTSAALFLFFPSARIATVDGLVCANPVGMDVVPKIGDRVVVFAVNRSLDAERRLIAVEPRTLVIERANGAVAYMPKAFADVGALSAEDVVNRSKGTGSR